MPNAYGQGWTEARVQRLKNLIGDGLSASLIAIRLGDVTRNAVIGKMHRLKLAPAGHVRVPSVKRPSAAVRRRRRRAALGGGNVSPRPINNERIRRDAALRALAEERCVVQALPDLVIPPEQRISLGALQDGNCKWPFGDGPFYFHKCEAKPGLPYCDFHAKRAYAPPHVPRPYSTPSWSGPLRALEEFEKLEIA